MIIVEACAYNIFYLIRSKFYEFKYMYLLKIFDFDILL